MPRPWLPSFWFRRSRAPAGSASMSLAGVALLRSMPPVLRSKRSRAWRRPDSPTLCDLRDCLAQRSIDDRAAVGHQCEFVLHLVEHAPKRAELVARDAFERRGDHVDDLRQQLLDES